MADTAERLAQSDPALTRLSFAEQRNAGGVQDGATFFSMLPDAIRLNHVLVELDLDGCQLGDEGAAAMAHVLRANRSLRRLRMRRNLVQNDGVKALCDGLERNPSLRLLDLSDNPGMGDAALESLASVLQGGTQQIEELLLNGNNAFSRPELRWSRRALRVLWGGVAKSRLTRFEMRSCGLSGAAVAALATDALAANPPLRCLDLSENRIGDHGAVPIARVLKHRGNTTLRELWLDDCCLGLPSFVGFGAALKSCECLGVLSLCHALPCEAAQRMNVSVDREEETEPTAVPEEEVDEKWVVPDGTAQLEGVQALSDGLRHNGALHTLRMGHCQVTDDALDALCHALNAAQRSGLTSFDLSANYTLSDRGAQVLKAFLQGRDAGEGGCRLRAVQLSQNDIDVGERAVLSLDRSCVEEMVLDGVGVNCGVAMALRDALASAPASRLRRLDLASNRIHREGLQRIGEILQAHPHLEDVSLRDNLATAHEGAAGLALDPAGRPAGLPRFKDWGVGVVRPFCRLLAALRRGRSPLRRLDLRDNTLTDQCIEVIVDALRGTDIEVDVDLRGNLPTAAALPLVDAALLREGLHIAIEHTTQQAGTEAP